MSEDGDSRWGTAFFLGFLLGVFVCLGAGGTFVIFAQKRAWQQAEAVRMMAEEAEREARMEAERARDLEMQARLEAVRAEQKAQRAKGADQKKGE